MTRCQIALGGNLGDVRATFAAALERLSAPDLRVVAVSSLFATPPMGVAAGDRFLNAAATLETSLGPQAVLDRLLTIEEALGRVRDRHWGPRPIDLDLIFHGEAVVDLPGLRVPHLHCWYRRFVLDPLAEIAANVMHPETGETVSQLRERLLVRPFAIGLEGPPAVAASLAHTLQEEFLELRCGLPCRSLALTLVIGGSETSAANRVIGLPEGDELVDAARAVLTAALGIPRKTPDADMGQDPDASTSQD
jgi:2-amino-4-hydroxy-6-hydroxymethyldihydropteridine diphosphokinase